MKRILIMWYIVIIIVLIFVLVYLFSDEKLGADTVMCDCDRVEIYDPCTGHCEYSRRKTK